VGASINTVLSGQKVPRPLTHDLIGSLLAAFGAKVQRSVIVRMENDIYYARIILEASNEIMERKIVELDARPSDCIALAVRNGAPLYVVRSLWERLEDVSETLEEMRRQGEEGQGGE
jgi:bifunctional DNase/RNase